MSVAPINPGLQALLETLARLHVQPARTQAAAAVPQDTPVGDRVELSPAAKSQIGGDKKTPAGS
jgi:hypothetical protein